MRRKPWGAYADDLRRVLGVEDAINPSMKIHMVKISQGIFGGGTLRGSLCGRLNNASRDGMNVTDTRSEVTCAFCLKRLRPLSDEKETP